MRHATDSWWPSGEMAALTRDHDWASTPLGPPEGWPPALKTAVGIVLSSNHPMFIWWGPDLIQFYNDAYRRTMGPERHPGALGQPGRACWEEIWPIIGPQIESIMAGGPATWHEDQLVPVTRHGRREDVWWTYGYSPIPDGDHIGGVLVVCTDVTNEHNTRQELVALNERLAAEVAQRRYENARQKVMFEQAPGFMCILRGPDHVFEFANRAYLSLVGGRDIIGKTVVQALPEARGQGFIRLLDDAFRTGRPCSASDSLFRLQSPDGAMVDRYVDFVYQPIIEANGRVSGIFVQGDDVTERTLAEQQLREADRRKDEFLAMLAHELRNPLAPISAAAQVLQLAPHNADRVRQASAIIGRQVDHMSRLVEDLLDVSRVSRGEVSLNRQPVDTRALVAAAVEQARPTIDERQQRFELIQPEESVLVFGDRKRLVQVLVNLLNNAAKYTQPGGALSLQVVPDTTHVSLVIRDNGIGIEPRLLPHVFELFTQAERSVDRAQGGLGIGLSLVKRIVELHGGTVEARSEGPHAGSEFRIRIPRYLEPVSDPQGGGATSGVLPRPRRPLDILIVDDNADAASTLATCLRDAGHVVDVETSALKALALASRHPADVYLLDIGLPEMDGIELARRLRSQSPPKPAVLIAVTGYGQTGTRQAAMAAGFDHYFVKPVEPAVLFDLLASVALSVMAEHQASPH